MLDIDISFTHNISKTKTLDRMNWITQA